MLTAAWLGGAGRRYAVWPKRLLAWTHMGQPGCMRQVRTALRTCCNNVQDMQRVETLCEGWTGTCWERFRVPTQGPDPCSVPSRAFKTELDALSHSCTSMKATAEQ